MIVILVGSIGRFPVAGHAWINLHYLLGLQALGHDVYYLEDAGEQSYVFHWQQQQLTTDLDYPANFIARALKPMGLGDRWMYRTDREHRGLAPDQMRDILAEADLLLIRGAPLAVWRDEYHLPRRRAYLDVDPLFTQVAAANGDPLLRATIDHCETLFTIGERIGQADCDIPDLGRHWHTTRSPIYLPLWPVATKAPTHGVTTIMQWAAYSAVKHNGRQYGNKKTEFPRFTDVARKCNAPFKIAMTGRPPTRVNTRGWQFIDGPSISDDLNKYQQFIHASLAEFSVAKHGYVAGRTGWFSDRTAEYLASGRPAIVQDTGVGTTLPVGEGLLTFTTVDEAIKAVNSVLKDQPKHSQAARRIAENYLSTNLILPQLLQVAVP